MTADCLFGAVSVTIYAKSEFINERDWSLCRKAGGT